MLAKATFEIWFCCFKHVVTQKGVATCLAKTVFPYVYSNWHLVKNVRCAPLLFDYLITIICFSNSKLGLLLDRYFTRSIVVVFSSLPSPPSIFRPSFGYFSSLLLFSLWKLLLEERRKLTLGLCWTSFSLSWKTFANYLSACKQQLKILKSKYIVHVFSRRKKGLDNGTQHEIFKNLFLDGWRNPITSGKSSIRCVTL